MFGKQEPEVLVAGAGPVGLFAAICLRDAAVRVQIVDKERRPASHSYALALHPQSLQLLADANIRPETIEPGLTVDRLAFYDGKECRAAVRLSELPGPFPHVRIVRQSSLEQRLERELSSRGVDVDWRHRLSTWTPRGEDLEAEIEKLDDISTGYPIAMTESEVVQRIRRHPRFLIGADGHRSAVRRHLKRHLLEMGPTELFGVFEFDGQPLPTDEIRVVLHQGTTNVLWPLPDGRCRWSFQLDWDVDEEEDLRHKSRVAVQVGPDYFPQLTRELLMDLIAERAPWFDAHVGTIYWSVLARFQRRLVDRFGEGHVWLAGDAAHLSGPVGVHSMNVGLREAHDLARVLIRGVRGEALPTEAESYGRQQTLEWRKLLGVDGVETTADASEWVRENRARILGCLPASGDALRRLGAQIGLDIAAESTTGQTA